MIGAFVLALLIGILAAWWLVRASRAAWPSRASWSSGRARSLRAPDASAGTAGAHASVAVGCPTRSGRTSGTKPTRHGQLIFVVPLGDGLLGLDCLLDATEECEPPGLPVHLVTALPASPWLAEVEQSLVVRWLTTGDPVDVELSLVPSVPRVTLTCDKTTLMLPLTVG